MSGHSCMWQGRHAFTAGKHCKSSATTVEHMQVFTDNATCLSCLCKTTFIEATACQRACQSLQLHAQTACSSLQWRAERHVRVSTMDCETMNNEQTMAYETVDSELTMHNAKTTEQACHGLQEVITEAVGGALQLTTGQAASAAPQLPGRPSGLQHRHQGISALPAKPVPPVPLLPPPLGSPAGLPTPPCTPNVLHLLLPIGSTRQGSGGFLSCKICNTSWCQSWCGHQLAASAMSAHLGGEEHGSRGQDTAATVSATRRKLWASCER